MKIISDDLFDKLIEYFESKSDADGYITGGFMPNEAMKLLGQLQSTYNRFRIIYYNFNNEQYILITKKYASSVDLVPNNAEIVNVLAFNGTVSSDFPIDKPIKISNANI